MSVAAVKPPAPYYGGKTRIAPWIVSLMSPHQRYLEPFCGTASVLLAKPRSRFEVINDRDGHLVNFFHMLRDRPDELERACRFTPYARDEFLAARDSLDDVDDDLERARRWWVRIVQGFNNAPGAWSTGWSLSSNRGTTEPTSMANLVERFEAVAERLRTVAIENQDALTLIERFDHHDEVIYCDPPYLGSTRAGRERRSSTLDYVHDMTEDADHIALAEVLTGCSAHVLISGYPSPLYEDLYAGWDRAESTVVRSAAMRRGLDPAATKKKTHTIEVVWSNRPLMSDEHLLSHLDQPNPTGAQR